MRPARIVLLTLLALVFIPVLLHAAEGVTIPSLNLGVKQAGSPEEVVGSLQILFILTILALAPSIMIMVTAFTRIVVVLGFLRQALGTQQMPPMQVLTALAIFLTFFVMSPTLDKMNELALTPYKNGNITFAQALTNAEGRYGNSCSSRQGRPTSNSSWASSPKINPRIKKKCLPGHSSPHS